MSEEFYEKRQVRMHVYQMPEVLNDGYCFGGGRRVAFLNVDFFDVPWDLPRDQIVSFVKKKAYFDAKHRFLLVAEKDYPTLTFTIEPH